MNRRNYRAAWLRLHKRYEARGLRMFRKGIRKSLDNIPFDNIETWNYEQVIRLNTGNLFDTYQDFYTEIGIQHGKKVGRSLNREINNTKNFDPSIFEGNYGEFIRRWLIQNAGLKITSVKEELIEYLIKFIAKAMELNTDIRTISRQLQKHILSRGFYRWQIQRIVRTETTAAANFGAIQAGESSGVIWKKEWISSNDSRTRRRPDDQYDHFVMDGIRVAKGEKFNVQGSLLDYPGDLEGAPGATINCRCTVSVVAKRDENGKIIFTNN